MALETGFKIIGTAGNTVDGRVIQESWLKQAAKNYDPEKYTAVLNLNHWNPKFYGTYGKVLAVKLVKNNEGKTCLAANIEPNKRLINIVKEEDEIIFTSMEIDPDFQKSSEAYLTGLAVTPKPASVGTEQITFSSEPLGSIQTSDFYQFDFSDLNDDKNDPDEAKFSKWLRNFFNHESTETEEPPMSGADDKKLEELTTQLSSLAAQVQKLTGENEPDKKPPQSGKVKADELVTKLSSVLGEFGVTLSVEQPKSDSERIDDLAKQIEKLTAKFDDTDIPDDKGKPKKGNNAELVALQEQVKKIGETLNLAINGEKPSTETGDHPNDDGKDMFV